MRIALFAGDATAQIDMMISGKDGIDIYSNKNISEGFRAISFTEDVEQIAVFDAGLFIDGRPLDVNEVFIALEKLAREEKNREVLVITKNVDVFNLFTERMLAISNARCELVDKINGRIIIDCILNRYKKKIEEEEKKLEEPIEKIVDAPVVVEKPKEVIKAEPRKKKIVEPVLVESPRKKYTNLNDLILSNKIMIVTGNPNSGTTSTCCEMANILSADNVDTVIIDCDIYTKGINMYFNTLDLPTTERTQQNGLINCLNSLDTINASIFNEKTNLDIIGLSSDISCKYVTKLMKDDELLIDLIHCLSVDYRVVIIHIPVELLVRFRQLIEISTNIVYCTKSSINGVMSIDKYLNIEHIESETAIRYMQVFHRKLKYLLTDVEKDSQIASNNFLELLEEVTTSPTLHQYILGEIPHIEGFDNFKETKQLLTANSKKKNDIFNIYHKTLENLFM